MGVAPSAIPGDIDEELWYNGITSACFWPTHNLPTIPTCIHASYGWSKGLGKVTCCDIFWMIGGDFSSKLEIPKSTLNLWPGFSVSTKDYVVVKVAGENFTRYNDLFSCSKGQTRHWLDCKIRVDASRKPFISLLLTQANMFFFGSEMSDESNRKKPLSLNC